MTVIKKGVLFILTVSACMLILAGCGEKKVNNRSPEAVVRSLIRSYQEENIQNIRKCYGLAEEEEVQKELQEEIDYNIRLFKAYNARSIDFEKEDSLGKSGDSQLIYVWYYYVPEDGEKDQKCPVLSFYFVNEKEKRYSVVPAKDVTEEMSEYSRTAYKKFTGTDTYKKYQKDFETFQERNPSYNDELDKRFSQASGSSSAEMKKESE